MEKERKRERERERVGRRKPKTREMKSIFWRQTKRKSMKLITHMM